MTAFVCAEEITIQAGKQVNSSYAKHPVLGCVKHYSSHKLVYFCLETMESTNRYLFMLVSGSSLPREISLLSDDPSVAFFHVMRTSSRSEHSIARLSFSERRTVRGSCTRLAKTRQCLTNWRQQCASNKKSILATLLVPLQAIKVGHMCPVWITQLPEAICRSL